MPEIDREQFTAIASSLAEKYGDLDFFVLRIIKNTPEALQARDSAYGEFVTHVATTLISAEPSQQTDLLDVSINLYVKTQGTGAYTGEAHFLKSLVLKILELNS